MKSTKTRAGQLILLAAAATSAATLHAQDLPGLITLGDLPAYQKQVDSLPPSLNALCQALPPSRLSVEPPVNLDVASSARTIGTDENSLRKMREIYSYLQLPKKPNRRVTIAGASLFDTRGGTVGFDLSLNCLTGQLETEFYFPHQADATDLYYAAGGDLLTIDSSQLQDAQGEKNAALLITLRGITLNLTAEEAQGLGAVANSKIVHEGANPVSLKITLLEPKPGSGDDAWYLEQFQGKVEILMPDGTTLFAGLVNQKVGAIGIFTLGQDGSGNWKIGGYAQELARELNTLKSEIHGQSQLQLSPKDMWMLDFSKGPDHVSLVPVIR